MTRLRSAIAITFVLALAAPAARADLVHLNTGGVVRGEVVKEDEESVSLRTPSGIQTIRRDDIDRIEKGKGSDPAQASPLPPKSPAHPVEDDDKPEVASPARAKLAPAVAKTLDVLKKQARGEDAAQREAAWTAIAELHAAQPGVVEKEALRAALGNLEADPRRALERNQKRIAQALPEPSKGDAALREKALEQWEAARKAALDVIFDLKIYPDENHGRAGQKFVDEKVEVVEKIWPVYDALIKADVARAEALAEDQAKALLAATEKSRALLREATAGLEPLGAVNLKPLPPEAPAGCRALVLYRAGRVREAWALKGKLSPWETRLLERLRDRRVESYNDRMLADKAPPEVGKRPNGEERNQVAITNEYRLKMGRPALEIHACLVESARGHSQEMTQLGYFEHESPVERNREPSDRARNAGYGASVGENISLGSPTPKATHIAWYNSSGHHRNILSLDWRAMGSGLDGNHWTQNFGAMGLLER